MTIQLNNSLHYMQRLIRVLFDQNVAITIQSNTTGCILPIGYNSNFAILNKQTNKRNKIKQNKNKTKTKQIPKKKKKTEIVFN